MQVMPVPACVTYIGRKTIEYAKNIVEQLFPGTRVIYADTDSLFILFPKNIIPTVNLFSSYILKQKKGYDGLNKTFIIAPKVAQLITAKVNANVGTFFNYFSIFLIYFFEKITGRKGVSTMRIIHEKSARFLIMYSAKWFFILKYFLFTS